MKIRCDCDENFNDQVMMSNFNVNARLTQKLYLDRSLCLQIL